MHDRKVRASAVGTQQAVLFMHRVGPLDLAGPSVQALEQAANPQCKDIARFAITDDTRPSDAFNGHVRQIDIEPRLPQHLASLGVQAVEIVIVATHEFYILFGI